MIAPRETPPLGELAATVENIWPEFSELQDTDPHQATFTGNRENYCIYGIWWRKLKTPNHNSPEWLLARQPLEHHRPGTPSMNIDYPPSHVLPLTRNRPLAQMEGNPQDFQLFDGRWWIHLQNHSVDTLTLRILSKEDLARFRSLHSAKRNGPERLVATALSLLKPADVRLSLPAVFRRDAVTREETLVGFPTLNVSVGQLGFPGDVCSWRVHYKKIDLSARQLEKTVIPGITHAMIVKELTKSSPCARKIMRGYVKKRNKGASGNTGPKSTVQATEGYTMFDGAVLETPRSKRRNTSQGKTIPLVPVAESKRHGRSEKRDGGGYNIKWEDFKDRF
jgi:hypothetical protein